MIKDGPLERIYRAHRLLAEMEAVPRRHGRGPPLYASEIHALCRIDAHPGINLTQLAVGLDVSKSAVSKVVRKLVATGFADKRKRLDNRKEVHFFPTAQGRAAVRAHRRFETDVFAKLYEREAALADWEQQCIVGFLCDLERLLRARIM